MVDESPGRPTKRDLGADAQAAAMRTRRDQFLELFDFSSGRGLEIGPLDAGIADPAGADVRFVDVFDTAGLRAHYAGDPNVILELIPEIDFALIQDGSARPLAEAVKPGAPYDWVIASHVIEHVPDMIGWLEQIADVTVDGGALILAVPDRRYCFDRHRPPTTTGQALEAYENGATRPGVRAVYDFCRSAVTVDTRALWQGARPPGRDAAMYDPAGVAAALERVRAGEYVDSHVWTFTPESFLTQVVELRELGLSPWHVETLRAPSHALEFHAVLRKVPAGQSPSALGFEEPAPTSDMPDWLYDEWVTADRLRKAEAELRKLRRRNDRLKRRISQLEKSTSYRLGSRLVAPFARLRGRR